MKDTRARDVQAFFERVAGDWDAMRLSYYDGRVIERMAEVSGADEGMTVADVGTGTGFVAAGIAPRVARVIAVDVTLAAGEGGDLAYSAHDFRLTDGPVPAGGRISGTVVFQAPEDADGLELSLRDGGDPVALPLEPTSGENSGEGGEGGGHEH